MGAGGRRAEQATPDEKRRGRAAAARNVSSAAADGGGPSHRQNAPAPSRVPAPTALRLLALAAGVALLAAGLGLGWLALFAARRGEGVFVPIAGVALQALVGGRALTRWALEKERHSALGSPITAGGPYPHLS